MRTIKNFINFTNEELDNKTYLDASIKLGHLGHPDRSTELRKHAFRDNDDIAELPITVDNLKYMISIYSIKYNSGNPVPYLEINSTSGNSLFDITSDSSFYLPNSNTRYHPLKDRKSALNLYRILKMWNSVYKDHQIIKDENLIVNRLYNTVT